MRRASVIVAGLALAILASLMTLPLAYAFVAAGMPGPRLPASLFNIVMAFVWADDPGRLARVAFRAAAETLAVACCAPVICAALIGEVSDLRSLLWYAGSAAVFSVLLPVAARPGTGLANLTDPASTGPLLAAGAVAGTVFWALAGRVTSERQRDRSRFDLASPQKSASETSDT